MADLPPTTTDTLPRAERRSIARPSARAVRWLPLIALIGVAVLPMAAAGFAALGEDWRPTGDWAVLTLRVEDVGHLTPLVGPYSRYGWNHPGPLLYWVLAAPYHLLGDRPVALLAATALVNAAAVATAIGLAWRRGGTVLAAGTAAVLALVAHSLGPSLLRDPWNPYITVLALAAFVMAAWSVAEGDRWALPVAVGVGSFLVQSHVGYAVVVGAVGGAAAVQAWIGRRQRPMLPPDRRARTTLLVVTVAVAAVAWLPVAVDEVAGSGNLSEIGRYFATSEDAPAGWDVAVGQASRQLELPDAPWLGDLEQAGADGASLGGQTGSLVLPVAAFSLALVAAARARRRDAVRFQVLVGVLAVSGAVATSRITGPVYAYLVRWWWVVAALWWLSAAWSAFVALREWAVPGRWRSALTVGVTAVAAAILVGAAVPTAGNASEASTPDPSATAILGQLLPPTVDALQGSGPVLVVATGSVWGTTADAVRLELERNGVEVAAPPTDAFRFGDARSTHHRQPVATVWVVSADAATEWRARAELPLLAAWDPLTPEERSAFVLDEAVLRDQLVAAGRDDLADALATGGGGLDRGLDLPGVDEDLLARVEATRRRGDPVAIFVGPPTDPTDPRPPWELGAGAN